MPHFQLEVGVCLAAIAVFVTVIHFIALSNKAVRPVAATVDTTNTHIDYPLAITRVEDFVDGYPLHESKFWHVMTRRKILLSAIFTLIVIIQMINVRQAVAVGAPKIVLSGHALYIFFSVFIQAVAVISVRQKEDTHALFLLHLTILTAVAVFLMSTASIIPAPVLPLSTQIIDSTPWYLVLSLYFLAFTIATTTLRGPPMHFPLDNIYSKKTIASIVEPLYENVSAENSASVLGFLFFTYSTPIFMLGWDSSNFDLGHLPILSANLRAAVNLAKIKAALSGAKLSVWNWRPQPGSGFDLAYRLTLLNWSTVWKLQVFAVCAATAFYAPIAVLQMFLVYLESDTERDHQEIGWAYVTGLFFSHALLVLVNSQLWSLASNSLRIQLRLQLNTILFSKTLVRKDLASAPSTQYGRNESADNKVEFSSKAEVMTLMTTDVGRVGDMSRHIFTVTDSSVGIAIGTYMLYRLLGVSCFIGLAVVLLFLPLNHLAGQFIVSIQENVMKAKDERVALTNEILGAIRMLKFMAWERSFEERTLKVRARELSYQKKSFRIETIWNSIGDSIPLIFAVASFWHFAVICKEELTPSVAFTAIVIFGEVQYGINQIPEFLVGGLQAFVSLRRIEKYLDVAEISVPPIFESSDINLQSATITWPLRCSGGSGLSTPTHSKFSLLDMSLKFPSGELSLICGKTGSGKTLLLLALLGEADVLSGQIQCPRSSPNSISSSLQILSSSNWIVQGICAYAPQNPWFRNQSIKENILFGLPYDEDRYRQTLEVCALQPDLKVLEDEDESEIGERGVNLSGGQKARVSLARVVYSRASLLLLDDVLSAVDAHTARYLYHECLQGSLMHGRTVILASHHVQLCGPGASYIAALDNGRLAFTGSWNNFRTTPIMEKIVYARSNDELNGSSTEFSDGTKIMEESDLSDPSSSAKASEQLSSTGPSISVEPGPKMRNTPRKLIEDEKRAVGHIQGDVWMTYIKACGNFWYWAFFVVILTLASATPVMANGWLKIWSSERETSQRALYYLGIYAAIIFIQIAVKIIRWLILYSGAIHASHVLYRKLLEAVLFANIRFHDTVSRGRLLNRFGKDFEAIDVTLPDELGRAVMLAASLAVTFATIIFVGGYVFFIATVVVGIGCYFFIQIYGQVVRDLRRLASITSSPLFSIYGDAISGLVVIRAFGASTQILRDMICCADTSMNPYYWGLGLHRWFSVRVQLLCGGLSALIAAIAVLSPKIDAALAGLALAFASTLTMELHYFIRRYVDVDQTMVALERIKEYSDLPHESPEFIMPRPPAAWPSSGRIQCEDLVIKYAPDLPNVLHDLTFEILPGEKVGLLGRTGSGKSTLSLSLLRFVEASKGKIVIDGIDVSTVGLTDLRRRLTIIPQEPVILSGTIRSTLDVFDEFDDADIYEALRRVHLISPEPLSQAVPDEQQMNANMFSNLESLVSELGENFSTGEKQLLCMARALLRRSKILIMDEATASVDYATDERISKTVREEFADSTILTIAHRLRTVIDYDRVMVLEEGRIVEFDSPRALMANNSSNFYALCEATGKEEFAALRAMVQGKK